MTIWTRLDRQMWDWDLNWSIQKMSYKINEYIHHLDSRIGGTDLLFLAHFGAPPVSGAKEIDTLEKKSLYCNDLSKKRP